MSRASSPAEEYNFDDFEDVLISNDKPKETQQKLQKVEQQTDEQLFDELEKQETTSEQQSEDKQQKQTRKQHKQSIFNIKTLVHYLNTCYGNRFVFKDGEKLKDEQKKKGKIIIDLSKIESLEEFKFVMYAVDLVNKKLTRKERWDKITHSIFDFKLRGILTAINDNELSSAESRKYKDKDYKLLMEKIIPQLQFDTQKDFNMEEAKEVMLKFIRSQTIRYKLLNKIFPHPSTKEETEQSNKKGSAFLNKLYIQQMSSFHDVLIKFIFTHNNITSKQLFELVCQKLTEKTDKITKDELINFDFEKLKQPKELKEFDKDVLEIVRQANVERNVCQKYVSYFEKVGCSQELYTTYKTIANELITLSAQLEKTPIGSYKDFINMFVKVFKAVDEPLGYRGLTISFMKDSKLTDVVQFSQKFRQVINHLVTDEHIDITFNGNMFMCKLQKQTPKGDVVKVLEGEIVQENKYIPQRVYTTLAKIGSYVQGKDIRTDISAGLGCVIMDYIRCEAEKYVKQLSKVRKCIYIVG